MQGSGVAVRMKRFVLGPFGTNCYVLYAPGEGSASGVGEGGGVGGAGGAPAWIVDAGFDPGEMVGFVREAGLRVEKIVLTHAHADHIAGLDEVREACPEASVLIHPIEAGWLGDAELNLSAGMGVPIRVAAADGELADGQELELGGVGFEVRHTPGHSPGHVVLHAPSLGMVLAGDTLFQGSVGRYDFPTSDGDALMRSIREVLYAMPDETAVYPGHGEATTIGEEKAHNPFVRA